MRILSLITAAVLVILLAPSGVVAQQLSPEEYVEAGERHLALGHLEEAREAFESAQTDAAAKPAARLGLARVAMEERAWRDALDLLDEVIEASPGNLDARLLRANAHRELAKYQTFSEVRHWNRAEDDYRWVLSQDSLHRDALLQYGMMKRYRDEHLEAIDLGELQAAAKPDAPGVQRGLLRIYSTYINRTPLAEVRKELEDHPSPFARYALAEALRREGRLQEADRLLSDLERESGTLRSAPILLARARIHYALGETREAQQLVLRAVDGVEDEVDAAFVFDDFMYVVDDQELEEYRALESPEARRTFLRAFWEKRDPLPARAENVRLSEHYRRLIVAEKEYAYDGFRLWHDSPDRLNELDFPRAYRLNDDFNDKGLVYIRHGEPDDRVLHVGSDTDSRTVRDSPDVYWTPSEQGYSAGYSRNESWRYYRPQRMDFHFAVGPGGTGNNWRLTPRVFNIGMLEALEHWGAPYSEMVNAARDMQVIQSDKFLPQVPFAVRAADDDQAAELIIEEDSLGSDQQIDRSMSDSHSRSYLEFSSLTGRMIEFNKESVAIGLTTDQHPDWAEDVDVIPMPHQIAAFRGEEGTTELNIFYALPIGQMTQEAATSAGSMEVDTGIAVYDTLWQPLHDQVEAKRLPTSPDPAAAAIDFFRVHLPPDTVQVSFHGASKETVQLAGHRFGYRVPDFSGASLMMSDVVLANDVGPARGSRFDRGEIHLSPNPFNRFSKRSPVYVYYEIYNLTRDEDDLTRFTIEYTLTSQKPPPKLFGLIRTGSRGPTLSVKEERVGDAASPVEYAAIDVTTIDPGEYTLTVTVTDQITGQVFERSLPLDLYLYEE